MATDFRLYPLKLVSPGFLIHRFYAGTVRLTEKRLILRLHPETYRLTYSTNIR
ncbi:hypothetical protein AHMF7616_00863 [Adhaeribacter pallidiroseus]|uniref:Uncharacterized protein n=1 Tax=Adhaeribacter pallidiroseus TaxID=2072847 RepID=A0A369QBH6_9BACT|nr:hypothetical protein AHMF7616_00863 [Adhaeribacter pallidiroseus]